MPKVSVLMPIWNTQEEHLREAIESILNQTFKDFELLILNDSPDNIRLDEIIASYSDPRIHYEHNEQNMGITPSRNKMLQLAQGEYLAVFDHDDISMPDRLAKQVAYLDAHPEVGVCSSWAEVFPEKRLISFPEDDYSIKKALTHECVIIHPAAMLRKSVLVKHGIHYEEEYSPAEDYRLWLQLIEHTRFHNIQEVLFKYRLHETNTSKQQAAKMSNAHQRMVCWAQAKYPELSKAYLSECEHTYSWRLFNLIPLITIKEAGTRKTIKLLGVPIFVVKHKMRTPR